MSELKRLLDAARVADEKVKQIQVEMLGHLDAETEEGKQAAMELRPALDAAKKEADEANQLYVSMRDSEEYLSPNPSPKGEGSGAARKFVPVPGAPDAKQGKTKTRAEFEAMSAADRMTFMLSDGKIVENE